MNAVRRDGVLLVRSVCSVVTDHENTHKITGNCWTTVELEELVWEVLSFPYY